MTDQNPLKGDRSAFDSLHFASFHASDLDEGQPTQHLPISTSFGDVPYFQGSFYSSQQLDHFLGTENFAVREILYDSLSPLVILTPPPDSYIIFCIVKVEEAFDGVGASMSIGVSGDEERYMASSDISLVIPCLNENYCIYHEDNTPEEIIIIFEPGLYSSTGIARIVLFYGMSK